MIRILLFFALIVVAYAALKSLFRSAARAYHEGDRSSAAPQGEEMVQDPECRTYVVKSRAVSRRLGGAVVHFCSESCAKQFEVKHPR